MSKTYIEGTALGFIRERSPGCFDSLILFSPKSSSGKRMQGFKTALCYPVTFAEPLEF